MEPTDYHTAVLRLLPKQAKDWAVPSESKRNQKLGYQPVQSAKFVCDRVDIPYTDEMNRLLDQLKRTP